MAARSCALEFEVTTWFRKLTLRCTIDEAVDNADLRPSRSMPPRIRSCDPEPMTDVRVPEVTRVPRPGADRLLSALPGLDRTARSRGAKEGNL